jgi:omega-6 fatty acid desaturase (delta-12 desaturase)
MKSACTPKKRRTSAAPNARPTGREVRAHIDDANRRPSTFKGLTLFLTNFLLYVVSLAAAISLPWWPAALLCSILCGLLVARLMAVGHEAAHNSLTAQTWLNSLLGRLTFLPSLHAFSVWRVGHNRGHHDFTNLKGKDLVWAPLSKEEYDGLSLCGRLLHRLYRTSLGVGIYYVIELWWKSGFMSNKQLTGKGLNVTVARLDRLLIVAFVVLEGWGLCALQHYLAAAWSLPVLSAPMVLVLGMFVPFFIACWFTGFLTFQHHTHPKIKWYADRDEWSFFASAVEGTTHGVLPWPLGLVLYNFMEHTAHHVDPRIPLYHLPKTQQQLETVYPEVVVQELTLVSFRRHLAACQLYDYQNHRWLDFAGKPTTPPLA